MYALLHDEPGRADSASVSIGDEAEVEATPEDGYASD